MRQLEVWLNDDLVGHVTENRKGGRFCYAADVAEHLTGSPLLSLSLPVKCKPYAESKTENWFNGLLPEGTRRQQIARSLGVSEYDWIGLLAEIGWECAGAVKVFEAGEARPHDASYEPLSLEELSHKLKVISAHTPRQDTDTFRMSIGGFQEKMCVMMPDLPHGSAIVNEIGAFLPRGDAASSHILKPEDTRSYPGCAESEAWAMSVASSVARCSKVALLRMDHTPDTLVVERYDRERNETGLIARVHQEDACQALGLPPSRKYATEGTSRGDDPTYKSIANLLLTYAADPQAEQSELLRQMVVNYALGNWDAHAKNVSFLFAKGTVPTVAPMYDVVPIAEVEPRTTSMSMRINGSLDPVAITKGDLISEAASWGMTDDCAAEVIDACLENIEKGMAITASIYPDAAKRHEPGAIERIERIRR